MSKWKLLWVDLEMTGLDPKKNRIIEFACILTDVLVESYLQGVNMVIKCDKQHLDTMDEWNTHQHNSSGLVQASLKSKITIQDAEQIILNFLHNQGIKKNQLILAGNSVHHDKFFLYHHMPKLNQFLHFRILDVSSINLIVCNKLPKIRIKKNRNHRAIQDIRQSINQLKQYIKRAFL